MSKNKKIPFWVFFPFSLQIIYIYYLYHSTQQALSVLLGMMVYLIFIVGYYYRYIEKIESLSILIKESTDKLKIQYQMAKFVIQGIFYIFIIAILISKLFKINFELSSSIALYSGVLGILTSKGIYDHRKKILACAKY